MCKSSGEQIGGSTRRRRGHETRKATAVAGGDRHIARSVAHFSAPKSIDPELTCLSVKTRAQIDGHPFEDRETTMYSSDRALQQGVLFYVHPSTTFFRYRLAFFPGGAEHRRQNSFNSCLYASTYKQQSTGRSFTLSRTKLCRIVYMVWCRVLYAPGSLSHLRLSLSPLAPTLSRTLSLHCS